MTNRCPRKKKRRLKPLVPYAAAGLMIVIAAIIVFALLLTISFFRPVYADDTNTVYGEGLVDEILPDMDLIMNDLEGEAISLEDLDLKLAIQIHNDLNPFEDNISSIDALKKCIVEAPYVYYLPVYKEKCDYFLTISKRRSSTGKWGVPTIGVVEPGDNLNVDFRRSLEALLTTAGIDNKDIYYVGWHSITSSVVAVLIENNSTEISDETVSFVLLSQIDPDNIDGIDVEKVMLPYSSIKEIILDEWKDSGFGGGGGNTHKYFWIYYVTAAGVIIIAVVSIMVIRKKQSGMR